MEHPYRHTKMIATIGPATESEEMLERLIHAGVDVCRLNMAHANAEWTAGVIRRIRKVCTAVDRRVAIMMDVKGPEIRTGPLDEPLMLEREEIFDFYLHRDVAPEEGVRGVPVNYPGFANDISVGATVLVDSGLLRLKVLEIRDDRVRCEVRIPGELGSRRHINLPGVKVNLPALTEKDRNDVKLGVQEGVEFFALSFVREATDLDILRRFLSEHDSQARIIAKIEDQSGLTHLDEIIAAADGLMVARGDLGIEIPFEELPLAQRRAVEVCLTLGKPVIIATHMLESMISQPVPTRAEITDVANAVFEQADAVMLSGETSVGQYPVECVEAMNRVIDRVEVHQGPPLNDRIRLKSARAKMLRAAASLAHEIGPVPLVAFTRTGYIGHLLSALRPRFSPIYAFTDDLPVFHYMLLRWGVEPFLIELHDNPENSIDSAFACLRERDWVKPGQMVVLITHLMAKDRLIDTIQIRKIPGEIEPADKQNLYMI